MLSLDSSDHNNTYFTEVGSDPATNASVKLPTGLQSLGRTDLIIHMFPEQNRKNMLNFLRKHGKGPTLFYTKQIKVEVWLAADSQGRNRLQAKWVETKTSTAMSHSKPGTNFEGI